jgi:hypothetical protein
MSARCGRHTQATDRPQVHKGTLAMHADAAEAKNRSRAFVQVSTSGCVRVENLDPKLIASLQGFAQLDPLLQGMLRVTVADARLPNDERLPNVLGNYEVLDRGIQFTPLFPFEPGIRYCAIFDSGPLGSAPHADVTTYEFQLPGQVSAGPAQVEHVVPSADILPENLLRFYVTFSSPMQRGQAEKQIKILGPDGRPAPDVLYRPPVELWDRAMRRLTLLLDPGRLKRRVGPNVQLGPPLKEGHRYALVVGDGMLDATGRTLRKTYAKEFVAGPPVRTRVEPAQWRITPPRKRTLEQLTLEFPISVDGGLGSTGVSVVGDARKRVVGEASLDRDGRRWTFTPASVWLASEIHIRIDPNLEDVCGNTLCAPFDVPAGAVETSAPACSMISVQLL